MAKKATQIEDVDTLLKRLEEMREAQAEFATFTRSRSIRFSMKLLLRPRKIVSLLLAWQLKRLAWV